MRQAFKRVLTRGLSDIWSLAHPKAAPGLRILLYHAVGTPLSRGAPGLSMPPALFRAQMEELKGMEDVSIAPLEAPLFPEQARGKARVAVTFDDGYRDSLETAAPILVELGIPFTVFAVPAFIESGDPLYMTVPQLRELARLPGCRVGSHGMSHRRLTELEPEEVLAELSRSLKWLEGALGSPVSAVSYPHGSADRRIRGAAAKAGYRVGACSRTGVNGPDRDPLLLCRTEILGFDGLRAFCQKVRGGWDWHRFRHTDPALMP